MPVSSRISAHLDTSRPKTSVSLSATTGEKSIASGHTSHGKMCENVRKKRKKAVMWMSRKLVGSYPAPTVWSNPLTVECHEEKAAPKGRRAMPKLPWELLTPFSDFVRGLPSRQSRSGVEEEEEDDEDEMQAYQDSMQRLRVSCTMSARGLRGVYSYSSGMG